MPKDLFKELETTTYKVLLLSLLFGMTHVKEKEEQKLFFDPDFDATFKEAVEFMKEKLSLTKGEFYSLDAKARFKAFTVARLTGLDAIERVKEKLTKALEEGKTVKEWVEELGEDGILKTVGFHQSNPWYLETVFRTNISTAYNAGRLMQIQRSKDKIKYLEYVAIDDNRTTPICRKLDGTKLPPDDPFWATYTPPNHFNCRSTVRAIFKGSEEAKRVRERKPKDIPPVPEGFAASPLDSWWKLTDSMAKRIVKYRLKDEVLEKAKGMCVKNFEDEWCEEYEEVKDLLSKVEKVEAKKKQIEEAFRKRLEEFSVDNPFEGFKSFFVSEREFNRHLDHRVKRGHIKPGDWKDYLRKTLEAIAEATSAYYEEWTGKENIWDKVLYNSKLKWLVVISEDGYIITSMRLDKSLRDILLRDKKVAESFGVSVKIERTAPDEELKKAAARLLESLYGGR